MKLEIINMVREIYINSSPTLSKNWGSREAPNLDIFSYQDAQNYPNQYEKNYIVCDEKQHLPLSSKMGKSLHNKC